MSLFHSSIVFSLRNRHRPQVCQLPQTNEFWLSKHVCRSLKLFHYISRVSFSAYNVPSCALSISLVLANSLISTKLLFFSLQYHLLAISLHGGLYMGYSSLHCQHVLHKARASRVLTSSAIPHKHSPALLRPSKTRPTPLIHSRSLRKLSISFRNASSIKNFNTKSLRSNLQPLRLWVPRRVIRMMVVFP